MMSSSNMLSMRLSFYLYFCLILSALYSLYSNDLKLNTTRPYYLLQPSNNNDDSPILLRGSGSGYQASPPPTTSSNDNDDIERGETNNKEEKEGSSPSSSMMTTATEQQQQQQQIDLNDLDFESVLLSSPDGIPCGKNKCFLPSKQSRDVGYLIGEGSLYAELSESYWFGKHLEDSYGVQNILLSEPQNITVSDTTSTTTNNKNIAQRINDKKYIVGPDGGNAKDKIHVDFCLLNDSTGERPTREELKEHPSLYHHQYDTCVLTIQKLRKLPFDDVDNTLFVKCPGFGGTPHHLNNTRLFRKWDELIDITSSSSSKPSSSTTITTNANTTGDRHHGDRREEGGVGGGGWLSLARSSISSKYKSEFLLNIQKSIDTLEQIWQNEIAFVYDMQFLVTTKGDIHHLDYDRIISGRNHHKEDPHKYNARSKRQHGTCMAFLNKMKHDIANYN